VKATADLAALLGRVLMSALFLWAGITKVLDPVATQAAIAKYGVTAVHLAYAGAIGIEIGVALMLLAGWKTRFAAFVLAVWCLATAWVAHFHPAHQGELTQFLKNLGLAGGFLQFAIHGAGRFSLDRR
jgi:putative oxidoreductase